MLCTRRQETHPVVDLSERSTRHFPGSIRTGREDAIEFGHIGHEPVHPLPQRNDELGQNVGGVGLEVAVPLTRVPGNQIVDARARQGRLNHQQVADARLVLRIEHDVAFVVGRNLIVTTAAGVQLSPDIAEFRDERTLDVHVDVFEFDVEVNSTPITPTIVRDWVRAALPDPWELEMDLSQLGEA